MRRSRLRAVTAALLGVLALALPGAARGVPAPAVAAATELPDPPDVLVTDQASKRLLLLDGSRGTWDPGADPSVVKWSFSPVGDPRYADLDPERSWVYPDEAKVRTRRGRTYVLITASFGFAAVVEYPSGGRYWGGALAPGGIELNPHSIELLPDGDVAVAASTGGVVRLYAAARSAPGHGRARGNADEHGPYASYPLAEAHGLQWDPRLKVLWALGRDRLVALRPGGTAERPTLTSSFEVPLPGPHGHDLLRVAGRPDRLWVTTGSAVLQYSTTRRAFVQDFAGAREVSRANVKAVGNDPLTGGVVSTAPERGLAETWWTQRVTVHRPDGSRHFFRLVDGGVYKARWWLPAPV
ncbi:DUF6528 family protein [Streptomyces sp. NPDC059169]|uniref:DUF6528 family protein n=1 Tax=Streptomyces sp. NPDC059169 TaxID=3346754 RepID=UPI0036B41CE8